jgi:hypothetical protein
VQGRAEFFDATGRPSLRIPTAETTFESTRRKQSEVTTYMSYPRMAGTAANRRKILLSRTNRPLLPTFPPLGERSCPTSIVLARERQRIHLRNTEIHRQLSQICSLSASSLKSWSQSLSIYRSSRTDAYLVKYVSSITLSLRFG